MTSKQYSVFDEPAVLYVLEQVWEYGNRGLGFGAAKDHLREWHSIGKRQQLALSRKKVDV